MHMPLCWLLLHSYCWQELVKSMWSKCTRPYTCGVYIFMRNTHVCSFVLSFIHFFHSRKSQHIWHAGTSAQYHLQWAPRAFQLEADESTRLEKKCERESLGVSSHCSLGRSFPGCSVPVSVTLELLCQTGSAASTALSGHLRGCDSRQGQALGQGLLLISRKGNAHRQDTFSSSLPCGCPAAVPALEP